jgi:hypothetical protein
MPPPALDGRIVARTCDTCTAPGPRLPTVRFVQAGVMLLGPLVYVFTINPPYDPEPGSFLIVVLGGLVGWNLLLIVATILVIIDSVRKIRAGKTRALATDVFVVKLAAIPFFLFNFGLLALFAVMGAAFWFKGGVLLLAFVPLEITLTYLAMLSTSVYGWASIARLRRDRVIGTGLTVLYSILLLIFVTDIVVGILLFGHSRRRPGVALAIVFLALGVALAAVPFLLTDGVEWLGFPGVVVEGVEWVGLAGVVVIVATIVISLTRSWRQRRRAAEGGLSEDEGAEEAVETAVVDKP